MQHLKKITVGAVVNLKMADSKNKLSFSKSSILKKNLWKFHRLGQVLVGLKQYHLLGFGIKTSVDNKYNFDKPSEKLL